MKRNLVILCVAKILLAFFLFYQLGQTNNGGFSSDIFVSNDYSELLSPTDNLIENGTYALSSSPEKAYSGRLPGYLFPYVVFRFLFDKSAAISLLILFQIALSLFAGIKLFFLIKSLNQNRNLWAYTALLLFFLFSSFIPWELWTYPESISVSSYILSLYYLHLYLENKLKKYLILSGAFLAWVFFLRGFLGVYFLAPILAILWSEIKSPKPVLRILKTSLVFLIPLLLMEVFWVSRNYKAQQKFIPLQEGLYLSAGADLIIDETYPFNSPYKPSILSLRELIGQWGGDNVHFYPGSEMSYFLDSKNPKQIDPYFPSLVFSKRIQKEDFISLKNLCDSSFNNSLSKSSRKRVELKLIDRTQELQNKFREDHGSLLVFSSMNKLKNLVLRNITSNWPGKSFSENSLFYKCIKLGTLAAYGFSLLLGLFSIVFVFFNLNFRSILSIILTLNLTLHLITFMFLINVAEYKYFMTGYVSLLILAFTFLDFLTRNRSWNK